VRQADADGQRADVRAAGFSASPIGEEGVVEGGQAHHPDERRQDAAEHRESGIFSHEAQQAGHDQQVDEEELRAEAEEASSRQVSTIRLESDLPAPRPARASV